MRMKLVAAMALSLGLGTSALAQSAMETELDETAAGLPAEWDSEIESAFFSDDEGTLRSQDEVLGAFEELTPEQQAQVQAHCATVDTASADFDLDDLDTGDDIAADTEFETETDDLAGVDAEADAELEGEAMAGAETELDAGGPDVAAETELESDVDGDAAADLDSEFDEGADVAADSEFEADSDLSAGADAEILPDAGTDDIAGAEAEAEFETSMELDEQTTASTGMGEGAYHASIAQLCGWVGEM